MRPNAVALGVESAIIVEEAGEALDDGGQRVVLVANVDETPLIFGALAVPEVALGAGVSGEGLQAQVQRCGFVVEVIGFASQPYNAWPHKLIAASDVLADGDFAECQSHVEGLFHSVKLSVG